MLDVAIIIVNFELKNDTDVCIGSFLQAGADLSQIIIVDNDSKDGSVQFLQEKNTSALTIIVAKENKGYAAGLNLGIQEAIRQKRRWVLLMNNDTIVTESFLSELEKATLAAPHTSLFGPMILYYSTPEKIWFLGGKIIPGTMFTRHIYRNRQEPTNLPDIVPVDFVHGCAMLVKQDVIQKIGYFNDSSLVFGEEIDFCWRAKKAGFKMAAVPHARMFHKISTTITARMRNHLPRTRYLRIRNQILFYRRYARGLELIIMVLLSAVRTIGIIFRDLFLGNFDLISPAMAGWVDGWENKGSDQKF